MIGIIVNVTLTLHNDFALCFPVQSGYAPPPGQPGQTVVVTQPTVVTTIVQQFRDIPVNTKCPHCQAQVRTVA